MPDVLTVAEWEINYQAQDRYLPGIVPSTLNLTVLSDDSAFISPRDLLNDVTSSFYIKIINGINTVWAGYLIADLGRAEVINGQRFVSLVASDGFGALDQPANLYVFGGNQPLTTQIAGVFNALGFWTLMDGFAVSETLRHLNMLSGKDALYWCGSAMSNNYFDPDTKEYFTYAKVISDICTTFGLQLFQANGVFVFRAIYEDTPAHYNYYNNTGVYIGQVTYTNAVATSVVADGVESYKPALRSYTIVHENNSQDQIGTANNVDYNDRFVGFVFGNGVNHADYNTSIRSTFSIPPMSSDTITYTLSYIWTLITPGVTYYLNSSTNAWQTTTYTTANNHSAHFTNNDPVYYNVEHNFNDQSNLHLPTFPTIGVSLLYLDVQYTQTSGPDWYTGHDLSYTVTYHGGTPVNLSFLIDNSVAATGASVQIGTRLGDSLLFPAVDSKNLCMYTDTARTTYTGTTSWEANKMPLLYNIAYRLCQKQTSPAQYYEISTTEPTTYGQTISWGTDTYFVVNLSTTEEGTMLTMVRQQSGTPTSKGRSSQSF